MPDEKTVDPSTIEMLERVAAEGISTVFDRADSTRACPIGHSGACCKNCSMGPCRLTGKTEVGLCGATKPIVAARNLARNIAAGAAAHSDHGRDMALTLLAACEGHAPDYQVRDERKLRAVAGYLGVPTEGRDKNEIGRDVALAALSNFTSTKEEIDGGHRAPRKRQMIWRNLDIFSRGIDREIVEVLHRTHAGNDQDADHIMTHALRCALGDGWGGSMLATDLSDVLFGTPGPVRARAGFGALSDEKVNLVIHGHHPTLSELIVAAVMDPEMEEYAKSKGAAGINVCGMCCTANEILMRHGVPVLGNYLSQELAIATGAVDAMVVDIQCIMQGLQAVAENYHTKLVTTSPKAHITGATRIEFDETRAMELAKEIVRLAVDNYPNRNKERVYIPTYVDHLIAGFSHEYVNYMQGGIFRESFRPLNDNIMNGRVRGAAGVVGCNNARTNQDQRHTYIIKELIKNDVAVVTTGCNAIACAKQGLLSPEVMDMAGSGLRETCQTIGIPPVLHVGSCVDNSRILTVLTQCATEGGLGEDISDLPVAGFAPEWMSEKALSIGAYFVGSGVTTWMGGNSPVENSEEVVNMITEGWKQKVGAAYYFEEDPEKAVKEALEHIDAKRAELKLTEYVPTRYARSKTYFPGDYTSFDEFSQYKYTRVSA